MPGEVQGLPKNGFAMRSPVLLGSRRTEPSRACCWAECSLSDSRGALQPTLPQRALAVLCPATCPLLVLRPIPPLGCRLVPSGTHRRYPSKEKVEVMASEYEFNRYKDKAGEWRWRFKSPNGKIMADSGEGYSSLSACDNAIDVIKREASKAKKT